MDGVKLFRPGDMQFEPYGGPPGKAEIARLVGPDLSATMGAGIATFDACSIEWTILYDEVIVVLDGAFRLWVGDDCRDMAAGDVIWLPEGAPLKYEGTGARVFYALAPVDWKARHSL